MTGVAMLLLLALTLIAARCCSQDCDVAAAL
jgi:hypothetical protein